jgi:hypothetical protein
MYDLLLRLTCFVRLQPGPAYYQQQADYKINVELDDKKSKLSGSETITYYNNSPDTLEYLWVQLDQNQAAKLLRHLGGKPKNGTGFLLWKFLQISFKTRTRARFLMSCKDVKGNALSYSINQTMMRINLASNEAR